MNAREESKIAAGEVETPCATFEPAGEKALDGSFIPYLTLDDQPLYRRIDGRPPRPDCGVETPEAAVEALVLVDRQHERYTITQPPIKLVCRCGWRASVGPRTLDVQWRLHVMAQLLAALRAQGWIPPGGTE